MSLHKLHRPSAFDTFTASRQVLEAFARSALLYIRSIVFYRNTEITSDGRHSQSVALLVDGATRTLIFDQARLSLETASHAAEVYYQPDFVSDSLRLPPLQAIMLIQEGQISQLEDPVDFFQLFGITMETLSPWLEREDHPLHQLFELTGSRLLQS